ncbi:MAG: DNA ligase D [Janthinobacterium lividum]
MAQKGKPAAPHTDPPGPPQSAGDAVDEQLARYRSMRDFAITQEPSGGSIAQADGLPFVIQKHSATRLHYDFRLGWNGVLKSWAVAKGPSYDVHDKRLAVQVEDHPIEYGGFEGIIPRGQYGGGTVMVWDQGTWEPHTDVDEGLRKGTLKFALHGTKLHGSWTLVRMGGKAAHEGKPNWLLIKEHDEFERPTGAPCITEEAPLSAVTGRSLEQIATASTHVWNSKETAGEGQAWYRQRARDADGAAVSKSGAAPATAAANQGGDSRLTNSPTTTKPRKATAAVTKQEPAIEGNRQAGAKLSLDKLPKEAMPDFLKPQLADEAEAPPTGKEWVHELKLDGYRVQAHKRGGKVSLYTRTGLDWTHRMQPIALALQRLNVRDAIVDGEVTVLDAQGLSSFARLQASFEKNEKHPLTFFAFDLLHANGHNTRDLPLHARKALLRDVMGDDTDDVRLSEDLAGDGAEIFSAACKLHAEGIISKRTDAPYNAGRSKRWLKSKCLYEQEFVVGGWVDLSNGSRGVGSLLLGYHDDAGKLIYAGRTGTGFTQKIHGMLRDKLDVLVQKTSPFPVISAEGRRGAHWVKPELVVQVRFATWTGEQQVRQAAYQGLREDKAASEVRREQGPPKAKYKPKEATPEPDVQPTEAKPPVMTTKPGRPKATKSAGEPTTTALLPMPAIRLTHPDKVVDTESRLTKLQLAEYLWAVSAEMLPHIADRPLSLVRCPEGSGSPCFYQKHVNHLLPEGVGSVMVSDKKGGTPEPYITLNNADALAGLAQMSVLEIHPWGSRNEHLEQPDRIVIDLDPDESLPWAIVAEAAVEVQSVLEAMGLQSFVKTTGGKGLHVAFPIAPEQDFSVMKAWAHGLVQAMEHARPQLYLTKMTKAARTGRIYLDYLRNERGATAVAPYSMRARSGAPVSIPLEWDELSTMKERPHFSIANFQDWQDRLSSDPWANMLTLKQSLSPETVERFAGRQSKRS